MSDRDRDRLLYDFTSAVASQLDLDDLLPTIVRRCREVLDAEGVAVLLLDAATDELYFPYVADRDSQVASRLLTVRLPATHGIAGAVLTSGRSEVVQDVARDARFYSKVDDSTGLSTRSMIVAPLITRRGPIGVIEVVNKNAGRCFCDEDLELLEALAGAMAIAIDNARMFAELKEREERLRTQVSALRRDLARQDQFSEIAGASDVIRDVLRLMESASSSPIAVLIEGETGTGKELVARGIHRASERADGAFVAVNCAALPADLLEAELFGHARGAFTGAHSDRRGLFEAADKGTIFLDEIGDLPLSMQVKLLRVLQEGEIMPVGTTKPRTVDVRVISATNRNLYAAVEAGTFRADLYYRVSAFPISVPALRERTSDIPSIADRFLSEAARAHHKTIRGLEADALAVLSGYTWPGNVRQLKNEIERAVVLTPDGGTIRADVFSPALTRSVPASANVVAAVSDEPAPTRPAPDDSRPATSSSSLREARIAFESRFIAEQLKARSGNVSRTAEALGISRVMLQKKMKNYGLR